MPTPDPYDLRRIFEEITIDLLHSFRRTFTLHQLEQEKEGFAWEQWQSAKLRHLVKFRNENRAIIEGRSDDIKNTITKVLDDSFLLGGARADKAILAVLFPKNLRPDKPQIAAPDDAFFGINEKKIKALIKTVTDDIQEAQHAVLRKMDDVYRQTIFRAEMHMSTGAKTLDQAIDMATKEFLDAGIQCVQYKNGRRVNITSYAEMALRTASQRATFMGEGQQRTKWGVHTVVVSAHASACELCLPWQGKILIDDVYAQGKPTGQYPLLSQAMKAGLFHPNCRHLISTYFPGITSLPKPIDEETARRNYEAEQKQRYIERQIRKWKRREAGSLDPANQEKARDKVKEWQNRMRDHLEENPQLRRDPWRERPGPGISNADIHEHAKTLKQQSKNDIIENIRKHIQSDALNKEINIEQQNKHIVGTHKYAVYHRRFQNKGQYGPSTVSLGIEGLQQLINQYAGTGLIKITKKGWNHQEVILSHPDIIGTVVNNLNGAELPTAVFKIHYGKKGVHIVPDYPSKKSR